MLDSSTSRHDCLALAIIMAIISLVELIKLINLDEIEKGF